MAANAADMAKAHERGTDRNLIQRLGLSPQKIRNLCKGIRAIADQEEPLRKVPPHPLPFPAPPSPLPPTCSAGVGGTSNFKIGQGQTS